MFEFITDNLKLRKSRRDVEIKSNQFEARSLELAMTTLEEAYEARQKVYDEDLDSGKWMLVGDQSGVGIDSQTRIDIQSSAYSMYHNNTHARVIIRSLVKFTLGKGPQIIPNETDDKKQKKILDIWNDFKKRNRWGKREKELATRLFRDGEVFLRKFIDETNGDMKVRFIRPSLIRNPINNVNLPPNVSNGIETDPDDIEEVISYYKTDSDGNLKEKISAEEIYHLKIFCDSDEKRGNSIFGPCIRRIKQYEQWLEDRVLLNKVRSAIALVKIVDSSSGKVNEIRNNMLSEKADETSNKAKMMRGGTVITASKGVDYKLLNPNINAADAKDDGRAIKLDIAAAVGFPEMIFTSDYSNANYSSSLIAQNPFVREIEEWQDFLSDFYKELTEEIIEKKKEFGGFPSNIDVDCRIEFPPMMRDDIEKLSKAFETLFKYKAISKKTWQAKMGLDPDIEKINIELEEGDEIYPPTPGPAPGAPGSPGSPGAPNSPFNLPLAPTNQFGAEIAEMWKAVKEKDWERVIEIAEEIEQFELVGEEEK